MLLILISWFDQEGHAANPKTSLTCMQQQSVNFQATGLAWSGNKWFQIIMRVEAASA